MVFWITYAVYIWHGASVTRKATAGGNVIDHFRFLFPLDKTDSTTIRSNKYLCYLLLNTCSYGNRLLKQLF